MYVVCDASDREYWEFQHIWRPGDSKGDEMCVCVCVIEAIVSLGSSNKGGGLDGTYAITCLCVRYDAMRSFDWELHQSCRPGDD